ncbi:MAG: rhodanese-like domain-containing protein [Bacteroidales bacterium]
MSVARISKEDLKQRLEGDQAGTLQILDARLKYPYEHSSVRLPGAVRVLAGAINVAQLARDKELVVYDSDPDEITSSQVAAELIRQGFRASALKGGISEWVAANFPVESKEPVQGSSPAPGAAKA